MKDSPDAKEKTSRRSFAKSVATALVAAPVVSSLSSCQKSVTVAPNPSEYLDANPPVIIDGGSLQIMIPAELTEGNDDPSSPPRHYDKKYSQSNPAALGNIKSIHIVDDYAADLLKLYPLGSDTLQVRLWIAKVVKDEDDDGHPNGEVTYAPLNSDPDIVIQGGKVEIRLDKKLDDDNHRKLYKRKKKNQKRYHIHDWEGGHSPFRIAKVVVVVSSKPNDPIYTALEDPVTHDNPLDNGMRIILRF